MGSDRHTVADAVREWLDHGLTKAGESTWRTNRYLAETHIIPFLGARRLRELSATEVDRWLAGRAEFAEHEHAAQAALRAEPGHPAGHGAGQGQAQRRRPLLGASGDAGPASRRHSRSPRRPRILDAVDGTPMHAYVVVSLLTGARTEELRALLWEDVDLLGRPDVSPPVPPSLAVWRSVRATGDTKTQRSRRTLALPARCVDVLSEHDDCRPGCARRPAPSGSTSVSSSPHAGARRSTPPTSDGTSGPPSGAHQASTPTPWTPRELRHSFVSLLSDSGVPIEEISRLVGHKSTLVTEVVYRKQLRPVIQSGATVMDRLFAAAKTVGGQFGRQDPSDTRRARLPRGRNRALTRGYRGGPRKT